MNATISDRRKAAHLTSNIFTIHFFLNIEFVWHASNNHIHVDVNHTHVDNCKKKNLLVQKQH